MRIVRFFAVLLTGALVALFPTTVHADESPTDLYAFSVQTDDCSEPGYVQINYARGVTWTIDGAPVNVQPPSSRFKFSGGLQGDVTAHPLPGYSIPPNVQSTFYMTIYPCAGADPDPEPACVPQRRVDALEQKLDRKAARIDALRAKVDRLRDRLRDRR